MFICVIIKNTYPTLNEIHIFREKDPDSEWQSRRVKEQAKAEGKEVIVEYCSKWEIEGIRKQYGYGASVSIY